MRDIRRWAWLVAAAALLSGSAASASGGVLSKGPTAPSPEIENIGKPAVGIPLGFKFRLAQENQVPLILQNCEPAKAGNMGVVFVVSKLSGYDSQGRKVDLDTRALSGFTLLMTSPAGQPYVVVKPMTIGRLNLDLEVPCTNRSVAKTDVDIVVSLPEGKPDSFFTSSEPGDRKAGFIYVELPKAGRIPVYFYAKYPGSEDAASIPPHAVKVRAINPLDEPPVLEPGDQPGTFRGLRLGHALIEARFQGKEDLTCITIAEREYEVPADCHELVPEGSTALPFMPKVGGGPRIMVQPPRVQPAK